MLACHPMLSTPASARTKFAVVGFLLNMPLNNFNIIREHRLIIESVSYLFRISVLQIERRQKHLACE